MLFHKIILHITTLFLIFSISFLSPASAMERFAASALASEVNRSSSKHKVEDDKWCLIDEESKVSQQAEKIVVPKDDEWCLIDEEGKGSQLDKEVVVPQEEEWCLISNDEESKVSQQVEKFVVPQDNEWCLISKEGLVNPPKKHKKCPIKKLFMTLLKKKWKNNNPIDPEEEWVSMDIPLAREYFRDEVFEKAIPLLEKVLKENPENLEFLERLGCSYFITEQLDKAILYLEKVLDKNPENPVFWRFLSLTYFKKGNFDTFISIFEEKIKKLDELGEHDLSLLGEACLNINKVHKATDYLEKAVEKGELRSDYGFVKKGELHSDYRLLGLAYLLDRRPSKAYDIIEKNIPIQKRNVSDHRLLAKAYFDANQYLLAINTINSIEEVKYRKEVRKQPDFIEITKPTAHDYRILGQAHFQLKNFNDAVDYLETLLNKYPENVTSDDYQFAIEAHKLAFNQCVDRNKKNEHKKKYNELKKKREIMMQYDELKKEEETQSK